MAKDIRDANDVFRDRSSTQDLRWTLLAFLFFVFVDIVVLRLKLT